MGISLVWLAFGHKPKYWINLNLDQMTTITVHPEEDTSTLDLNNGLAISLKTTNVNLMVAP